jgi:hypothetical protein
MRSERRVTNDRRHHDRRTRITAIQATHDDLRTTIEQTAAEIERLKAEQQLQLVRIAQIQREIDELKKSKR